MTVSKISRKFSRTCRRAAHLCIKRGKFSRKSHWNDTGARLASSWQPTGLSEPHKAVLSEEPFNLLLNFDSQQLETGEVFFLGGQRYIEMAKNATSCLVQCLKDQVASVINQPVVSCYSPEWWPPSKNFQVLHTTHAQKKIPETK